MSNPQSQSHTISSLLFESVEAQLPSVAPPPLESFDQVFEDIDLDSLYADIQSLTLPIGPFPPYQGASTPTLASSSEFSRSTYSTELITTNSEYSTDFQHIHVVKPQSDDGPIRPPFCISPHRLPATFQSSPSEIPMDTSVNAAPATQIRTGPIRTKSTCPLCDRLLTRKNMATHMETHNPNRERPFVCPECKYAFTRSNDLKRHLVKKHGDRAK